MGKIKSAICLTLITLVIAVLCVTCFVPFPVAWAEKTDGTKVVKDYFNPLINWADKTADFGNYLYGGESAGYVGGSYSVVLYPDGVISAEEYEDDRAELEGEEKTDYEGKYVAYANGSLYLEKETVTDGGETPSEEFLAAFEDQVTLLRARFEALDSEGLTMEVRDGLTVRVTLPTSLSASVAAFLYFSYMGDLTVSYGTSSDAASATQILPEAGKNAGPIGDYIKGASARTANGTAYVLVDFTDKGLDIVRNRTSDAASTAGYLFLRVGDETIVNLSVSTQIDDDLYISGSYTSDSATIVATTIDTALRYGGSDFGMTMGELHQVPANFGSLGKLSALNLFYIAFGVCFLAMAAFFLIRYGRLGFAHLYSYLIFLVLTVVCFWAIPIPLGVGAFFAFALASALLCVSNAVAYEYVRKEYMLGKMMAFSVKTGYRKSFWHIFDLHIVLLAVGLLTWLIALSELSAFALAFTLCVLFSGICSLAINRFMWYIMMPFAKDAGKFCHFKREEVDDDD